MAPVRKEDDFRARPIKDWQSWIDEAIETAQAEGQFDNLPGQGKPIQIETNPFEPEMDAAYSPLRQAGYAPTWMELDREITTGRAELDAWLERSAAIDRTIVKFHASLPRTLWHLERMRLTPEVAGRRFDDRIPVPSPVEETGGPEE